MSTGCFTIKNVTMSFIPGRVMDLCYDEFQFFIVVIPAIIKTHRIYAYPEITQVSQQMNRALMVFAGSVPDQAPDRFIKCC